MRKEKGLRLKDLEDYHISSGSISNLERGEVKTRDGTFEYLLKKLGLTQESLKKRVEKEKEEIEELQFTFECVKTLLEQELKDEVSKQLDSIQLENFHPLITYYCYLKGLFYRRSKNWKMARKYFHRGLDMCKQHKLEPSDNILAVSYNQLSIYSFNQNNFTEAIEYANKGLKIYDASLALADIKFSLISNKILYLIKLSQYDLATQLLNEVWDSIDKIERTSVALSLYKYRAIILRRRRMFSEAIAVCKAGIRLAGKNEIQYRHLDLINVMGSIFLEQEKWDKAEKRFQMVLLMDQKLDFPRRQVDAHIYLGVLYSKQKEWGKANEQTNTAIKISREIPDDFRSARALIVLGDILFKQMKWEKALSCYQEAVDLTRKHRFKDRQLTALSRSARCFDILDKHEELVTCMKQILEIQNDLKITIEDEIYDIF
ncbi:helix-turn-helix transcriptional regulator [Shimazuella sp. AN120528]|nr:helix-turn-helix transcriptional regulator [Shimazuella soli]